MTDVKRESLDTVCGAIAYAMGVTMILLCTSTVPRAPKRWPNCASMIMFFSVLTNLIKDNWKNHNALIGFAMDHGCHEIDGGCGSHGLDMPEDLNIVHLYKGYPKEKVQ